MIVDGETCHDSTTRPWQAGHDGDSGGLGDVNEGSIRGKFTREETELIQVTIENYRHRENITKEEIENKIFLSKKRKGNTFWQELVAALPGRSYNSVYTYVRRAYDPLRSQGKWIDDEDQALIEAMKGQKPWKEVSCLVGRPPSECQDRWRNHVSIRDQRGRGRWLATEVEKLEEVVKLVRDEKCGINWSRVSTEMGGIRSRQQCQDKWNQLSRLGENEKRVRWNEDDTRTLVQKVKLLQASDVNQIKWANLSDKRFPWKGKQLKHHWFKLAREVEGYESKTHAELVDALVSSV